MGVWVVYTDIQVRLVELGIDITVWNQAKIDPVTLKSQRRFELLTHRTFESTTTTRKLNGSGKHFIVLPFIPIISIEYIKALYSADLQPVEITGYIIKNEIGQVIMTATQPFYYTAFPEGEANLEAKWTHGYADIASIPLEQADIKNPAITA